MDPDPFVQSNVGSLSMSDKDSRIRIDPELVKLGEIVKRAYSRSMTRTVNDGYKREIIHLLKTSDPNIQVSSDMREVYNYFIKWLSDEKKQIEDDINWLMAGAGAHEIVITETINNNLNSISEQISQVDQAIDLYGKPKIHPGISELLKCRMDSSVITKIGKMFLQMYADNKRITDWYILVNEIITCIPSPKEQEMIFPQYDPDQEIKIILHVIDSFYREQLNKMADEIHENINHQITAQKTDIPAPV